MSLLANSWPVVNGAVFTTLEFRYRYYMLDTIMMLVYSILHVVLCGTLLALHRLTKLYMHFYSKQPSKLVSSSRRVTVKVRIAETLQGLTNRLAVKNYLSMCQNDCIISSMFGRKEIDLASISPHSHTKECF